MAADPFLIAERWLSSTLCADPTLLTLVSGCWSEQVPEGEPWFVGNVAVRQVVWSAPPASVDDLALGGDYVTSTLIYLVQVLMPTMDGEALSPATQRIDALLHRPRWPGVVLAGGGRIFSSVRVAASSRTQDTGSGVMFKFRGGRYALTVQED